MAHRHHPAKSTDVHFKRGCPPDTTANFSSRIRHGNSIPAIKKFWSAHTVSFEGEGVTLDREMKFGPHIKSVRSLKLSQTLSQVTQALFCRIAVGAPKYVGNVDLYNDLNLEPIRIYLMESYFEKAADTIILVSLPALITHPTQKPTSPEICLGS